MAIYDKQNQSKQNGDYPCYQGCAIVDRVLLHRKQGEYIQIGVKKFHCLRRFLQSAMPQCKMCCKDMNRQCFSIPSAYYSDRLVDILIQVYKENAQKGLGDSAIWWDNQHFNDIITTMHNPKTVEKPAVKDYFQKLEEQKDEQIF